MTAIYPDVATAICARFSTKRRRVILTRSSTHSTLRTWGLQLREGIGFKRAGGGGAQTGGNNAYDA